MARSGGITMGWAGGEYAFRLAWGQLMALQEACDAGPAHVLDRLTTRRWRIEDVEQVLVQGLIGGGLEVEKARRLVRINVREQLVPLSENVLAAQAVLLAALNGAEDEPLDEITEKPVAATETGSAPSPGES